MTAEAQDSRPILVVNNEPKFTALETANLSGGLPYSRERLIHVGKIHLEQIFTNSFEFGKCLALLQQKETAQTFAQIVEEDFGISLRSAQHYIRFALVASQFPRFRDFFTRPRMMNKGLALLEGVRDPENDELFMEFEQTGQWGDLEAGELLEKSVKQLKSENKRLRREKDLILAGATKELKDENEKLRAEVESLEGLREQQQGSREQKKAIAAAGKLIEKAREVLGRVDWPQVRADEGLRQVAYMQYDAAERLGGYLLTVLDYTDDK